MRRADPTDGRAKLIVFAPRGWAAIEQALNAFERIEADLGERVGAPRLRSLRRTLADVADVADVAGVADRAGEGDR
jgi:DNA-binding MarR family transcriptional regulator